MLSKIKASGMFAVLAIALASAPAVQAQPRGNPELGAAIAAQGNGALETIRSELRRDLRVGKPVLPAPAVTEASGRASAGPAATARCAE